MSYVRGSAVGDLATISPKDQTDPPPFRFVKDGDLCHFLIGEEKCRGLLYKGKWAWVAKDVDAALDIDGRYQRKHYLEQGTDYDQLSPCYETSQILRLLGASASRITLLYRSGLIYTIAASSEYFVDDLRAWLRTDVFPLLQDTLQDTEVEEAKAASPLDCGPEQRRTIIAARARKIAKPKLPSVPGEPLPIGEVLRELGVRADGDLTYKIALASNALFREAYHRPPQQYTTSTGMRAALHTLPVVRHICVEFGLIAPNGAVLFAGGAQ